MARPTAERIAGNELREELRQLQGNRCHYCGCEMEDASWGYPRPPRSVTLEHLCPRAAGGTLSPENCVASCHECNSRRNEELKAAWVPLTKRLHKRLKKIPPSERVERLARVAEACGVEWRGL